MDELMLGDCVERLKTIESESIDSLVTDPPAGIAFMGKDWDKDKGGRDSWIAWMQKVMGQCFRVMKPGAHGFVWALPRTSHWTATALEDAGFDIRDVVTHVFGSGFPKSHDVSKALDKMAGAEREVLGPKTRPDGSFRVNTEKKNGTSFRVGSNNKQLTAPTTDAAKQWDGWGTALKPASEHWILIRKPLSEKTVAKNVLKHGSGGINIDATRIDGIPESGSGAHINRGVYGKYNGEPPTERVQSNQGRFPANFICSGEARDMLDEQSGVLKNGGSVAGHKVSGYGSKNIGVRPKNSDKSGDSGGASRFFFDGGDTCNVNTAVKSLYPQKKLGDFVQRLVAIEVPREAKPLNDLTQHFTNEMRSKLKSRDEISTLLIQFTVEKYLLELKHIESYNDSPAVNVALQRLIDITMTMTNLLMFNGYAEAVTLKNTSVSGEHGAKAFAKFRYCAKASKSERGKDNSHPTVKPLKLMRYLLTMITPPKGHVLDPFAGSGSTGVAAKQCGMKFTGIEAEAEYYDIAKSRIEATLI